MESNVTNNQNPPALKLSTEGAEIEYETLGEASRSLAQIADLATGQLGQISADASVISHSLFGSAKAFAPDRQLSSAFSFEKIGLATSFGALALDSLRPLEALADLNESICRPSKEIQKTVAAWSETVALPKNELAATIKAINQCLEIPQTRMAAVTDALAVQSLPTFTVLKSRPKPTVGQGSRAHDLLVIDTNSDCSIDEQLNAEDLLLDECTCERVMLFDRLVQDKGLRQTSRQLFIHGHYALAVRQAVQYVNNRVKEESGVERKDGVDLMFHVFREQSPVLALNSLQTNSDIDEQRGYMHLFAGTMAAIRNPRTHEHDFEDDPEVALELLIQANHLMRMLESAMQSQT